MHNILSASRAVDMASLQRFAEMLNRRGCKVNVFTLSSAEMRTMRMKAAKHMFM